MKALEDLRFNATRRHFLSAASLGKDACKSSGTRWVEPLVPGNAAAPFHPNARGMAGVTPAVVAAAR